MSQRKALVDSNSYFRLAKSVHPLLFREFGAEKHCLYVLIELDNEYARSTRLKSKFPWVSENEYSSNRKNYLSIGRKDRKSVEDAYDYIWGHIQTDHPGPSQIDALYLAHSYILGIPVVTDDRDMRQVAEAFGIETIKTLELLKLMVDTEHVPLAKVSEIVEYWKYIGDIPADFAIDFKSIFPTLQKGARAKQSSEQQPGKRPKS